MDAHCAHSLSLCDRACGDLWQRASSPSMDRFVNRSKPWGDERRRSEDGQREWTRIKAKCILSLSLSSDEAKSAITSRCSEIETVLNWIKCKSSLISSNISNRRRINSLLNAFREEGIIQTHVTLLSLIISLNFNQLYQLHVYTSTRIQNGRESVSIVCVCVLVLAKTMAKQSIVRLVCKVQG